MQHAAAWYSDADMLHSSLLNDRQMNDSVNNSAETSTGCCSWQAATNEEPRKITESIYAVSEASEEPMKYSPRADGEDKSTGTDRTPRAHCRPHRNNGARPRAA